jgi:hypothetical protein
MSRVPLLACPAVQRPGIDSDFAEERITKLPLEIETEPS